MDSGGRRVLVGQKEKGSVNGILEEEEHLAFTHAVHVEIPISCSHSKIHAV